MHTSTAEESIISDIHQADVAKDNSIHVNSVKKSSISIASLPPEILQVILSYCPLSSIWPLRSLCRSFKVSTENYLVHLFRKPWHPPILSENGSWIAGPNLQVHISQMGLTGTGSWTFGMICTGYNPADGMFSFEPDLRDMKLLMKNSNDQDASVEISTNGSQFYYTGPVINTVSMQRPNGFDEVIGKETIWPEHESQVIMNRSSIVVEYGPEISSDHLEEPNWKGSGNLVKSKSLSSLRISPSLLFDSA